MDEIVHLRVGGAGYPGHRGAGGDRRANLGVDRLGRRRCVADEDELGVEPIANGSLEAAQDLDRTLPRLHGAQAHELRPAALHARLAGTGRAGSEVIAPRVGDGDALRWIAPQPSDDLAPRIFADAHHRIDRHEPAKVLAHPGSCARHEPVVRRLGLRQRVIADHRGRHAAAEKIEPLEHARQVGDLGQEPGVVDGDKVAEIHLDGGRPLLVLLEEFVDGLAQVIVREPLLERQRQQLGRRCLVDEGERTAPVRHDELGLGLARWPVDGELLQHPLDAGRVGVADELLEVNADRRHPSGHRFAGLP
ncbi:unannotated protein [freshwater metagenome]|uniref:Unannotated protein n=1 Tax=freshwater metagenome TaxID=449393 RepID=A0A6J7P689_9ZZZZ